MTKEFDPDEILLQLEGELQVVLRETATRVASSVVLSTPIGRPDLWINPPPKGYRPGTARGNWRVGIGTIPVSQEIPEQDPAGAPTIAQAQAVIRQWDGKQALYISNAADHIAPLMVDGTASRQTRGPDAINKAIKRGLNAVNRVTKELK